MRPWLPATLLTILVLACNDEKRAAEQKREETARFELRLMSNAASAAPVLEQRIDEWISKRDGVIFAIDQGTVYAVPGETPWMIQCDDVGLRIWLGAWMAEADAPKSAVIERELSSVGLNQAQCKELASIVSRKMRSITHE